MRYEYRCPEHGIIELSHGMTESRDGRLCPICKSKIDPIISGGMQIILTGRPPWAYNDIIKSAKNSDKSKMVNEKTKITDKRDNSKYKGQSRKVDNSMGCFNAQW